MFIKSSNKYASEPTFCLVLYLVWIPFQRAVPVRTRYGNTDIGEKK